MSILLTTSLILIGDSITFGIVSTPVGPSYADVVSVEMPVVNLGIGGSSTADWINEVVNCTDEDQSVSILLGTNDAVGFLEPFPITPAEYSANLATMVGNLTTNGCQRIILMTPPQNFAFPTNPDVQLRLAEYRLEVLELCDSGVAGLECGPDVWSLLGEEDFDTNNVHPNGPGHQKIGNALVAQSTVRAPRVSLSWGVVPATLLGLVGFWAWILKKDGDVAADHQRGDPLFTEEELVRDLDKEFDRIFHGAFNELPPQYPSLYGTGDDESYRRSFWEVIHHCRWSLANWIRPS